MRIKFQAESLSFCATGQVFVQSTLIVQSPSGESIANLKESVSFIPAGGPSDQRFSFQWRSSSVNGAPVFDLDHVTGGRIGWNVVTGYLNSAAKGIGLARQPEHDTRYEIAEEYMQIVYNLWEGSWEDVAVLRDRTQRVFARPEKVHRIRHDGRYFQIEATHLCEPSPQRTPLIYQAGASSRGRQFAATHAEWVFINGPWKRVIAPIVADIRRRAAAAGRNPAEILIFTW